MHLMRKADRPPPLSSRNDLRPVWINVVRSCGLSKMKPSKKFLHTQNIAASVYKTLIDQGWIKIPPGWALVPIEPAPEQIDAGDKAYSGHEYAIDPIPAYRAMVKATPPAPAMPPYLFSHVKPKARK